MGMILNQKQNRVQIEETLFSQIQQGDNAAFEKLYYLTYKPLYAFILSLTLNKEDAEDIMQETYIKIRGSCHLYKSQGNPMAWIMKIAKNIFLMKIRQEKNKETVEFDECRDMLALNQISSTEDRLLLEHLFQYISEIDRNIIILHIVAGMKHKEIAQMLQMPVGTVLSRYHRAMKTLKRSTGNLQGKEQDHV